MMYSNLTPVVVPKTTTMEQLDELAKARGWRWYRYDARRGVLYAETAEATPPLLREERPSMFHLRQAT